MQFTYQGDTFDHVLDMTADGADCGKLLTVTPPLVNTQLKHAQINHLKLCIDYNTFIHAFECRVCVPFSVSCRAD